MPVVADITSSCSDGFFAAGGAGGDGEEEGGLVQPEALVPEGGGFGVLF